MSAKYSRTQSTVTGQETGYAPNAFIGLISEMDVIGEISASPATPADTFKISTDHTFVAGTPAKGFAKIYFIGDDTSLAGNSHGTPGASNGTYELKCFMPGDGPETQAMVEYLRNKELMILVDNPKEPAGDKLQFGSRLLPAHIMPNFESGTLRDGRKGYTFTITSVNRFYYSGDVTLQAEA